ncbi:16S rRNA (adenine(1518)-N(6)/adenine(1519)-N(6))-dimethyltransferase RsmA [Legionella fairfieldensis]|uniref:16S rRNA (adenine(1518)-N(6)/adenine(1519)-N(6))- dimethyltransferase RsmA n=1 Tax=Legionella fairfieldensis TaxID=45064 RepID=UPI00048E6B8F|nr:16S rRNA (adenine(1518)-N(6)/adenine(1519)-N(6))-dimethyltransferase RsmA [Legionella fairfieldensis]
MSHRPRKRFGQNFLQNKQIIHEILSALQLRKEDKVVEIGPGLGALTLPLLRYLNHLTAIEIDTDLHTHLTELPAAQDKLHLIGADALTVDYSELGSKLRIVGNLPYNISTPLLLHLMHSISSIEDMHFMLQKEVVSRLAARPGTKAYGRLTVMIQYYCDVEWLFDVPPEAFYPQPKVDSAVVRITPYQASPYSSVNIRVLEQVVAQAFAMRRKTLANNLKPLLNSAQLCHLEINPQARPEQISIRDYVQITNFIAK